MFSSRVSISSSWLFKTLYKWAFQKYEVLCSAEPRTDLNHGTYSFFCSFAYGKQKVNPVFSNRIRFLTSIKPRRSWRKLRRGSPENATEIKRCHLCDIIFPPQTNHFLNHYVCFFHEQHVNIPKTRSFCLWKNIDNMTCFQRVYLEIKQNCLPQWQNDSGLIIKQ